MREQARQTAGRVAPPIPWRRHIWGDRGNKAHLVEWARAIGRWIVAIVARPKGQRGFAVLPRR
jgi:hypothetical protein